MMTAITRTARKLRHAIVLSAVTVTLTAGSAAAFPEDVLGDPETHWIFEILDVLENLGGGGDGIDAPDDGEVDVVDGGGGSGDSGGSGFGMPNVQ
jgi:hypothetical protein